MARGVNIDPANGVAPTVNELAGFSRVRFAYNVSRGSGNTNLQTARLLYAPFISSYVAAGITPMLVLTHETWGEGRGFNWHAMSDADWWKLIEGYAAHCGEIASTYGSLVIYQIWNEGDSASVAAVGIPPAWYARLLDAAMHAIHSRAPAARIVSQGHVLNQPSYWTAVRQVSQRARDLSAVCVHTYGHGPPGAWAPFGPLGTHVINRWRQATTLPIMVTEWGMLNMHPTPQQAADYARGFMAQAKDAGVKEAYWFAWANQHNNVPVQGNAALKSALVG